MCKTYSRALLLIILIITIKLYAKIDSLAIKRTCTVRVEVRKVNKFTTAEVDFARPEMPSKTKTKPMLS